MYGDKLDIREDIECDIDGKKVESNIIVPKIDEKNEEEVECNHVHNDLLIAASKGRTPIFRNPKFIFDVPWVKNVETLQTDWWNTPVEKIHVWTKQELEIDRQNKIKKFVPLLLKERRGRRLLRKHVNNFQWKQYINLGFFCVKKAEDKLYKIHGYYGVQLLDDVGRDVIRYCLHGNKTDLPQSDILIMQKLMIEAEFEEFERLANITYVKHREHFIDKIDPKILSLIDSIKIKNDDDIYHQFHDSIKKMEQKEFSNENIYNIVKKTVDKYEELFKEKEEWDKVFEKEGITDEYQKNDFISSITKGYLCLYSKKLKY